MTPHFDPLHLHLLPTGRNSQLHGTVNVYMQSEKIQSIGEMFSFYHHVIVSWLVTFRARREYTVSRTSGKHTTEDFRIHTRLNPGPKLTQSSSHRQ